MRVDELMKGYVSHARYSVNAFIMDVIHIIIYKIICFLLNDNWSEREE